MPDKRIKVLMLGAGGDVILNPLAQSIKEASSEYDISVSGLYLLKEKKILISPNGNEVFEACYPHFGKTTQQITSGLESTQSKTSLTTKLRKWVMSISWFNYLVKIFLRKIRLRRFKKNIEKARLQYDLIHLHGLMPSGAHDWVLEKNQKPFVVSCWGSDVLRNSDIRTIALQQKILHKAKVITVTGPEFKEIVLAKYGRDLEPKIHFTYFDPALSDYPTASRETLALEFRNRHEISSNTKILAIGHNGHRDNNHLKIIESLDKLSDGEKSQLYCVIQMTYSACDIYCSEVELALSKAGLKGEILTNFLSRVELRRLRMATDILLYTPLSDAFSASVSQALAAGSVVILGSWLPYKERIKAGFRYWEVDSPSEAHLVIAPVLSEWNVRSKECIPNRELSANFFSRMRQGRLWCRAYQKSLTPSS